jgi:RNA polymerase sigma factor (sigma-70 family)
MEGMDDGHDLVVRTIQRHAPALLRTARKHSLCADDAHDAYQRAMEIFLRRAPSLDPKTAHRWLHVVVTNEARAVRRARLELVGSETLDALPAEDSDDQLLRWDRLERSAEALQRLKPQELTALWLKATGLSYAEIAERQSWSRTKVNRCLVEGRRAFLERYAGIEAGEECERWAPVVAALVDGEATADQVASARPHLRRCPSCRATVRELRLAGPRLAGVLPALPVVATTRVDPLRTLETAWGTLQELGLKLHGSVEVLSGAKLAAVASVAVVAGGGATLAMNERHPTPPRTTAALETPGRAPRQAVAKPAALVTPAPVPQAMPKASGSAAPKCGAASGAVTVAGGKLVSGPVTAAGGRSASAACRSRAAARAGREAPEFSRARVHEFGSGTGKPRSTREFRAPAREVPVGAGVREFAPSKALSAGTSSSVVVEHRSVSEFGGR